MDTKPLTLICFFISVNLLRSTLANEKCQNNVYCAAIGQFDVTMKKNGEAIELTWVFNSTEHAYSFQAFIYDSNNELYYESPKLHQSERSLTINKELEGGQNKVCLRVLYDGSEVLIEKCENFEESDLKILIGILAGTIFLIPCLVALAFIIYKDRKISRMENYVKLGNKDDTSIEYEAMAVGGLKGKTNIAFAEEVYPEKVATKLGKSDKRATDNTAICQIAEEVNFPKKVKCVVEVDYHYDEVTKDKTRPEVHDSATESIYVIKL